MSSAYVAAAAAATAAHFYFSPIPEVPTIHYVGGYFAANILLAGYVLLLAPAAPLLSKLLTIVALNTTFCTTATVVTLTRRLFFDPLCRFPGPKLAAATKLWAANEYRLGRHSLTVKALHKKYNSDFVRIGPHEVSIRHVQAVERIYKGKYVRGTFYEVGAVNGEFNLNTTRDYGLHTPWRRIW